MRRREFVAGGAALAAAQLAFPAGTLAQTTSTPRVDRIVDAHCHIFNAADLPIEGFARKIMVPRTVQSNELVARFAEYPGALEALVHAVAVQVKRGAPDSQAEIEMIEEFERDLQKKQQLNGAETRIARNCEVHFGSSGSTPKFSAAVSSHCQRASRSKSRSSTFNCFFTSSSMRTSVSQT
jgi:hypothetical protein